MGPLNVIHVVIMVIVLVLLVLLFKVNNSIKLERRIGRYSTYPVNDEDASLMGSLESRYNHFVRKLESKVKGNGIIGRIANRYNTTTTRVERAIRHAIEISWIRGDLKMMEEIFGNSIDFDRSKPTNSEFLTTIADRIKLHQKELVG